MQDTHGQDSRITRYTNFIIRWRWGVIVASLALSLLLAAGASQLGFKNDYRVFFSEDNPHLQAFEQQQKTYTKNDNLLFVISPNEGGVFDPAILSAVEEVTREAWRFPFALRVDSLSNFQYSRAEGDELIVEDLVENAAAYTPQQLAEIKQIALAEPFIVGQLLNKEATVTAVNVTVHLPELSMDEAPKVVAAARELKTRIEAAYPVEVHLSGVVMMSNAFFESSMKDMQTLLPAMYLIIILTMMLLLRSVGGTFATLLVIVFSMVAALGAAGWAGMALTPPSSSATTIIMTLAVADSVHILVTLFSGMRKGMSRHEALRYSMRLNFSPVFLTSATTVVGFLSMNTSDAPPFHDLGNITAFGVLWAWVLSITLLPALIAVMPLKAHQSDSQFGLWMQALGDFVIRQRKAILGGFGLFSLGFVALIPLNVFDDSFVAYFDESVEFRRDTDYINDNLGGIYQIQYSLSSGADYGVSDPEFLHKVESFVNWWRAQPEVTHVNTVTDTFKRINKNMHEDDAAFYRLPDEQDLSAQYLLLYELSLPEGLDLNNQMDIGKSATQVIVTLNDMPSSQIAAIAERGQEWLEREQQLQAFGVGPAVMFAYISKSNIRNMLVGTFISIVIISLLIALALRSARIGVLSLIPNLLPIAMAFGLWGLIKGEVNVAVSMVVGMVLGIVVDDTVHFLSKYLVARKEQHLSPEAAVRYAFSSVGVALVVTTLVLVAGFVVLTQSSFGMNSNMGALTAIAIALALLTDLLLLPVLLMKLDRKDRYATAADKVNSQPTSPLMDTLASSSLASTPLSTENKETHYA